MTDRRNELPLTLWTCPSVRGEGIVPTFTLFWIFVLEFPGAKSPLLVLSQRESLQGASLGLPLSNEPFFSRVFLTWLRLSSMHYLRTSIDPIFVQIFI